MKIRLFWQAILLSWFISVSIFMFNRNYVLNFFQQGFGRRLQKCAGSFVRKIFAGRRCSNKLRLQKIQNCHQIRCLSMFNFDLCKKLTCFLPLRYQSKFLFFSEEDSLKKILWCKFLTENLIFQKDQKYL